MNIVAAGTGIEGGTPKAPSVHPKTGLHLFRRTCSWVTLEVSSGGAGLPKRRR